MELSHTRFAVLLFTDIVDSTGLKVRYGVPAYSEALLTHNRCFERLARESGSITILQNTGDGYFAEATGIAEVVRFALLFQDAMREGPWTEVRLTTRIGIHAGEVVTVDTVVGSGLVSPAADLAARVMSLAIGGQILLTRFPFDEARHFLREHPHMNGKVMPPLRWLAHGPYLMKGQDEVTEIFEVGAEGFAPLIAPPDGEKAKRAIRPGDEETLGWRPAVGLDIPGRTGWHLSELLGVGGFGEVWAGEHIKLRQRRAFKFCFDDERLRALKREVTLVRLLQNALGKREDIVHIHELKLDAPPFYLESDLAPHGNLLQWAAKQGGIDAIPLPRRVAIVAHTASALAAAHSIGVLHKDIKPTNILIFDGHDGEPRPRLVDFGIGTLSDSAVLGQFGVTAAGFTRATIQHSSGTPTYSPPEYLAGRPYTIQGDIYGLGVLLYQLTTGKANEPLAPGWERDVSDPLLRSDISACVDGDPARRLPSASDLADRLFRLEARRTEIQQQERLAREAAAWAEAEAAAEASRHRAARFRRLAAAFASIAVLALASGVLAWRNQRDAESQRRLAESERDKANQLLNEKSALLDRVSEFFSSRIDDGGELAEDSELKPLVAERFDHFKRGKAGWTCGTGDQQLDSGIWIYDSPDDKGRGGGCFSASGFKPGDGTEYFIAPDDFLGDQSKSYDGFLEYHVRKRIFVGESASPDVEISSGTLRLVYIGKRDMILGWQKVIVPLSPRPEWRIGDRNGRVASADEFRKVLGTLETLRIRAEDDGDLRGRTEIDDVALWDKESAAGRRLALEAWRDEVEESMAWRRQSKITTNSNIEFHHLGNYHRVYLKDFIAWAESVGVHKGVAVVHPHDQRNPAKITYRVPHGPGNGSRLEIVARGSHVKPGNLIRVRNGARVLGEEGVDDDWKTIQVPLDDLGSDPVELTIEIHALGWYYEHCLIDDVRIVGSSIGNDD